jgi:NADH dehydrogenase [ubiquinone] 1 alpha subcomplex assembly factor 1
LPRSRLLVAFDGPASVLPWSAIDDAVMGGLSSSRLLFAAAGHADFIGTVSLANNGGFASVRTRPAITRLPVRCSSVCACAATGDATS